jgi:peptidoglycan/LPS O-acetylase OafA/YrhL
MTWKSADQWLLKKFRRITSSDAFFPEIDGLRFLAILCVVLFHSNTYILNKAPGIRLLSEHSWIYTHVFGPVFLAGQQGVELFFVISGLILSLPFARAQLGLGQKPSYLKYLKRRLTRLEPPYMLTTVFFFFAAIVVVKNVHAASLWPSLLASLTYTHNFFYPRELPRINCVLWSLEIEIQFYLLAPAICRLYFSIRNASARRIAGLLSVGLWAFVADRIPGLNLLHFGYFFVSGLVLCDIVCSNGSYCGIFRSPVSAALGAVMLAALLWTDFTKPGNRILAVAFPCLIVLFYLVVLLNSFWKRIFSHTLLVVIGGMCYSIYLLHYPLISQVGRFMLRFGRGWGFGPFFCLQLATYVTVVLAVSALFFKTVERPCMRKEWPSELRARLRAWPWWPRQREAASGALPSAILEQAKASGGLEKIER